MDKVSQIIEGALERRRKLLLEHEAETICREYGISTVRFKLAETEEEAVKAAEEIGCPVALKIVSPDIPHKTEVGGVNLNLKDPEEVRSAYHSIMEDIRKIKPDAEIAGVLVQEMASPSTEVIVGAVKDPQFCHAVMFGLGGVFVEIYEDVAFRITPVTEKEAREMITEVKAYPLLTGYRNLPPADIDAIVKIILGVSRLVTEHPEIKELDLNPIIVYPKGAKVVDAKIILE